MIRMRGVETSRTMLPCRRGVHLHKSASLKMIFEKTKQIMQFILTIDPKTIGQAIKNHPTYHAEQHRNLLLKIRNTFRYWLTFWSQLLG